MIGVFLKLAEQRDAYLVSERLTPVPASYTIRWRWIATRANEPFPYFARPLLRAALAARSRASLKSRCWVSSNCDRNSSSTAPS